MINTTILTITVLTGLLILGFSFEALAEEPNSPGPVPVPYPNIAKAQTAKAIPDWVKNQFEWYVNGEIDEKTLLTSMNWMFDNNVMHLSEKAAVEVHDLRMRVSQLEQKMSALSDQYTTDSESGKITFGDGEHGMIPSTGSSSVDAMMHMHNQIADAIAELSTLHDDLAQITKEIQALQANAPDTWDTSDNPSGFDQARSEWQDKMNHLMNQQNMIQSKIEKAIQELEQLQGKLSVAHQKDQTTMSEMMAKEHDAMKQQMDTALHQFPPSVTSKTALVSIPDENGVEVPLLVQVPDDSSVDVNEYIQSVLRESYIEQTKDLQYYAEKVRYYNDMKDAIRDHISEMHAQQTPKTDFGTALKLAPTDATTDYDRLTMKADLTEHEKTISKFLVLQKELETIEDEIQSLTERIDSSMVLQKTLRKDITLIQDAVSKDVFPAKVLLSDDVVVLESARDADALIKKWEDKLESAGDDAQLANIDLQNMLQKQQQTLQTISNVSKMMHDTAMAVIRKIG